MKFRCIVCTKEKYCSRGFWTKKERSTGLVTCGTCRRLSKEESV